MPIMGQHTNKGIKVWGEHDWLGKKRKYFTTRLLIYFKVICSLDNKQKIFRNVALTSCILISSMTWKHYTIRVTNWIIG